MTKIIIANFSDDKRIADIRRKVFIEEQNVPEALEWDKDDTSATHILAIKDSQAVATARLLNNGHIGRMAVLKEHRHQGIGSLMLSFLLQLAKEKGYKRVQLSSQEHATGFYKKMGFRITSDVYPDAGIPHYDMSLEFNR